MKIRFFGATRRVTGSNYLLEAEGKKIIVDCGMFQGSSAERGKNYDDFDYSPSEVDAVIITHSHIDHIGRIPKLIKNGFGGPIYSTNPVRGFAKVFLEDTLKLMKRESKRKKKVLIWDKNDLEEAMKLWKSYDYHRVFNVGEIKIEFYDAGHILGSSILKITAEGKTIIFSGDLGNPPVPLLSPTEVVGEVDYIVTESTYGDRLHEEPLMRKIRLERTLEDINSRGGVLLIPSFAMERTQELLYEMNELIENHRVREMPIFVDSPLAIKATEIYGRFENYFNKEAKYLISKGDDIFDFPGLKLTRTAEESKQIRYAPQPKVIIAGSGMSTGGRILFHEKNYLSDPKNIILFIGFQVKGTLGRRIKEGERIVKIDGKKVEVNAEVREIASYSAHADQNKLIDWISKTEKKSKGLKKIFITHGELDPAMALSERIEKELKLETLVPEEGQEVEL